MKQKLFFSLVAACICIFAIGILHASAATFDGLEYEVMEDGIKITSCDKSATSITIPSGIDRISVTRIGSGAFNNHSTLKSVTIPDTVTHIDKDAFFRCESLTEITIPNGVKTIGKYAFAYCSGLTSVTISSSVEKIDSVAFIGCTDVTSVTFQNGVTNQMRLGDRVFEGCTSLTTVTIPAYVTTMGNGVFSDCTSMTSMIVEPNNPSYCAIDGNLYTKDRNTFIQFAPGKTDASFSVPSGVTSISGFAFSGAGGLKTVIIPEGVTSIGENAFLSCSGMTSIKIPNSVNYIGSGAFLGCIELASVTIPDAVTQIEGWVFANCRSMTDITIPGGVTSIDEYAFTHCDALKQVYYNGTREAFDQISVHLTENTSFLDAQREYFYYVIIKDVYGNEVDRAKVRIGSLFDLEKISSVYKQFVTNLYKDSELREPFSFDTPINSNTDLYISDLSFIAVTGDDAVDIGQQLVVQNINFAINKSVKVLICTLKHSDKLTLREVNPKEFQVEITQESYTQNGYTYCFLKCTYPAEENIPINKIVSPCSLTFEITQNVVAHEKLAVALVAEETYLADSSGNTYDFENNPEQKWIRVKAYSEITNLSSDIGVWDKAFSPEGRAYTIYVPKDTPVIRFAPQHGGSFKCGSVVLYHDRVTPITLSQEETTLHFTYAADGYTTSRYTVTIIKFEGTKTTLSDDKRTLRIKPVNLPSGCRIVLALYDENGLLTESKISENTGNDIVYTATKDYTTGKVMAWDGMHTLTPRCAVEPIPSEY